MNKSCFHVWLISVFMHLCVSILCMKTDKCYLNSETNLEGKILLSRISPLFGQTFRIDRPGYHYLVGICTDASDLLGNASVTKNDHSDHIQVLGRRNETYVEGGDTWMLLRYGCNYCSNNTKNQCLGNYSASVYVVCDPVNHDKPTLKVVEEDDCHYNFVLPTSVICEHEKEVSGSTVFLILLAVAFFMYFLIGIIYRRLIHNAQGCQQLPHFSFWQRIGALCSDGCSYLCRCDVEPEDFWNNINSNFDSGDRDDALLKP